MIILEAKAVPNLFNGFDFTGKSRFWGEIIFLRQRSTHLFNPKTGCTQNN